MSDDIDARPFDWIGDAAAAEIIARVDPLRAIEALKVVALAKLGELAAVTHQVAGLLALLPGPPGSPPTTFTEVLTPDGRWVPAPEGYVPQAAPAVAPNDHWIDQWIAGAEQLGK